MRNTARCVRNVRCCFSAFYAGLAVVVGIEATGAMQRFLELLEELGIEYRVGHPAKIRAKETRNQKHDRWDAGLLLELLVEGRF
jgi:transposase